MRVAVLKESFPGERRVALVPSVLPSLAKRGLSVELESGAGHEAGFTDESYSLAGATIGHGRAQVARRAEILLALRPPLRGGRELELELFREGQLFVCQLDALSSPELAERLASTGVESYALELMPRITRAQSMDVLSSQSNLAGYRAVLLAAEALPRVLPMMMTAAGTLPAARVLVLGAGVAGLQAIATAKRLGAVVEAYDVRPEVREQVQSVGGRFVTLEGAEEAQGDSASRGGYAKAQSDEALARQREALAQHVRAADVVIAAALVPGTRAPLILTKQMMRGMRPGSVIVDLAAEQGGNCELTHPGEAYTTPEGVQVLGPVNLPSSLAHHASQLYAKNITAFLLHLLGTAGGSAELSAQRDDDPIARETRVTRGGALVNPRVLAALETARHAHRMGRAEELSEAGAHH